MCMSLTSLRYSLPLYDTRSGLDLSSTRYIGHVSELTSGLASVVNELSTYDEHISSKSVELSGHIRSLVQETSLNDVPVFLDDSNTTASDTLSLDSILKSTDAEPLSSNFPASYYDTALLSTYKLAHAGLTISTLFDFSSDSVSLSENSEPFSVSVSDLSTPSSLLGSNILSDIGYSSAASLISSPTLLSTRPISYIGQSLRLILKTWLR